MNHDHVIATAMSHPLSGQLVHTCTINSDDVGGFRITTISKNSDDVGGGVAQATISMTYRGRG